MRVKRIKSMHGFSLIEVLIVMSILSLVMMAVYSLYLTHQRTAYTQDEVVEVQQNLRIAIDTMTRDLRLAGFLISSDTRTPVDPMGNDTGANNSDVIRLNYADVGGIVATIAQQRDTVGTFTVNSADAVNSFAAGDHAHVIRSSSRKTLPTGGTAADFSVTAVNSATPSITLSVGTDPGPYTVGDLIVKVTSEGSTATYCLGPTADCGSGVTTCPAGQLCLMRITADGANVVAQNMENLQLSYIMDPSCLSCGSSVQDMPTTANNKYIRAVRIVLTGKTVQTTGLSDNVAKKRIVETTVTMRN